MQCSIKKSFVLLLFSALFILCMISCGENKPSATTGGNQNVQTAKTPVTTDAPVIDNRIDISSYTIVRKDAASAQIKDFTSDLHAAIEKYTGADLKVQTDYDSKGEIDNASPQILIGETNRAASIFTLQELEDMEDKNYIIKAVDNKIVILGKDNKSLIMAIKNFTVEVLEKCDGSTKLPIEDGYILSGNETYETMFPNGVTMSSTTLSIISEAECYYNQRMTYPRAIKLEHNGKNNGMMLACTITFGKFVFHQSTDDGITWEKINGPALNDTVNEGYITNWMPQLFELPCKMGDYKEGTIIFGATSREKDGSDFEHSTITLFASTKLGRAWTTVSNIATGGGIADQNNEAEDGVWEPYFIFDEEAKRLYCFYSDDSDPAHGQTLVCKYTTDLENWSEIIYAVKCDEQKMRPGMPVLVKMNNGKYLMVYEMVGIQHNPIYMKTTDSLDDWGDVADYGTEVKTTDGKGFGSSPYVAYSPTVGEGGMLVMCANHQIGGQKLDESTGSDVFISFDMGKTFTAIACPVPDNRHSAYSQCVFFGDNGHTLYYISGQWFGEYEDRLSQKSTVALAIITVK